MKASAASEMLEFEGWRSDLRASVLLHQNARETGCQSRLGRVRKCPRATSANSGALVSKDAIMEAAWPGVVVEANT